MVAIAITRTELTASELRAAAARSRESQAARRILALALVLEGFDRKTAAETCGMDRQTLRDWVHRYNAEGLAGLSNRRGGPRPRRLDPGQVAELVSWHGGGSRPGGGRGGALAAPGPAAADRGAVAEWRCTSGRSASTWRRSATGGSRCARTIRRPIRRRRRLSKNFREAVAAAVPQAAHRQTAGKMVPDAMKRGTAADGGVPHAMELPMPTNDPATDTTMYLALDLSRSSWLAAARLPRRREGRDAAHGRGRDADPPRPLSRGREPAPRRSSARRSASSPLRGGTGRVLAAPGPARERRGQPCRWSPHQHPRQPQGAPGEDRSARRAGLAAGAGGV